MILFNKHKVYAEQECLKLVLVDWIDPFKFHQFWKHSSSIGCKILFPPFESNDELFISRALTETIKYNYELWNYYTDMQVDVR